MIIYNVTLSINPEIETEVLSWLKDEHIPEVIETGVFIGYTMFKVLEQPNAPIHNSYAIQYKLESWDKFNQYETQFATALKSKTQAKFGENVLAFRTFLEEI
jgi:hypothetical protein